MQPQIAVDSVATRRSVQPVDLLLRMPALVALFVSAAALYGARKAFLQDSEIWWQIRTGLWILQNHAVPRHGIYSQHAAAPWTASSWLYDFAIAIGYNGVGLRIFPLTAMLLCVALAIVTFLLARGREGNFWGAVALSAIAQYAISGSRPLPGMVSILLFGITLALVLRTRGDADTRRLFWLPPLFVLWANVDAQFVLGLGLIALFLAAEVTERRLYRSGFGWLREPRIDPPRLATIVLASFLATFVNPYTFHLLPEALHSSYSRMLFQYFGNMSALGFRHPRDFVLLLLSMSAFVVLGRSRPMDLFKLTLLTISIVVSLRIQRDSWIVGLVAIGVIGDSFAQSHIRPATWGSRMATQLSVAALVIVAFCLASLHIPSNAVLSQNVYSSFPAKACDFIRSNRLPQPLFNAYGWGGFLTWYLPEYPVAIDSRIGLYGDKFTESYFKVSAGTERMETNAAFAHAQTLLLERRSGMAKALTNLPGLRAQFRVAYQDELAIVLVRQ